MILSIQFTVSCNHHDCPFPEHFHQSTLKLYPVNRCSPFLHPASPWCLLFCSVSECLVWADSCDICPLCLAYFTQHNIVRVCPCCSVSQKLVPFSGWRMLTLSIYCILLSILWRPLLSIFWRPFGFFPSLDYSAQLWPRTLVHTRLCESLLQFSQMFT